MKAAYLKLNKLSNNPLINGPEKWPNYKNP